MSSSSSNSNAGKKPASGKPTIRTLADLNRHPAPSPGSDSDEPQEFYTGGEKSGMLVQDPTKRNDVNSFFEQARQLGMLQTPFEPEPSSSSGSFAGTGRLLTGETVQPIAPQQLPQPVIRFIHLWNNGFSVDDGPLRRFDDPANAPFLQAVMKSECPKELEPTDDSSRPVHVNVLKHHEDYQEPVRPAGSFQGVGRTLGSAALPSEPSSGPTPAVDEPRSASRPVSFSVDDSLPYTSIQLRLADGTRMVARFNMHHNVEDIRAFIDASQPGAATTYHLQTGFPPKQLTDSTQTIEQAGLANSVIIQKL